MGTSSSKVHICALEQRREEEIRRAREMSYRRGQASEFYFSCGRGELERVREILDSKTSPPIEELNELQANGSTALHAATHYNHPEIVRLLLQRDCPRSQLNRFGKTAYEEAPDDEMRRLFDRDIVSDRFHDTNTTANIAIYLPENNNNANSPIDYVHLFKSNSEVLEHSLNQQTTAMWLKFYNWFTHTFRTFIERDDFQIDRFDLQNHPDFHQFLHRNLPEQNLKQTMKSVNEFQRRNSIEPLITLYTSEGAGFYQPLNRCLTDPTPANSSFNPHLCDRFLIEFHLRRAELKQRAFTGVTYRGATIPTGNLSIYRRALESEPKGILSFKAFTSTSRDYSVALKFATQNELNENQSHVLFVFEITRETSMIVSVEDLSIFQHEQEVLILPGNLFTVTQIQEETNPNITKIYLKHWHVPISFWKKIRQTIRAGNRTVLSD